MFICGFVRGPLRYLYVVSKPTHIHKHAQTTIEQVLCAGIVCGAQRFSSFAFSQFTQFDLNVYASICVLEHVMCGCVYICKRFLFEFMIYIFRDMLSKYAHAYSILKFFRTQAHHTPKPSVFLSTHKRQSQALQIVSNFSSPFCCVNVPTYHPYISMTSI